MPLRPCCSAWLGVVAISAASQAAEPSTHKAKTLTFDVVFSPFSPIAANNVRDPNSPFALGDELVFHDQLFSKGKQVGDEVGSCVIASITPELLANCTLVVRLPGGNITGQFVAISGPTPKELALTAAPAPTATWAVRGPWSSSATARGD